MARIPLRYRIRTFVGSPVRRAAERSRHAFLQRIRRDCRLAQQQVFQRLLALNADSAFSADYGLRPGMTVAEYRHRIPVSDYSLIRPYIARMQQGEHRALLGSRQQLMMFAVTSGTTAESKLIPVTDEFVRLYRKSWQIWGIGAYLRHTRIRSLNILQVSSSHRRFLAPDGTPCGNISGLVATMQNPLVRSLYTIPPEVAEICVPESRRYAILRLALADPFIGMMITANPITLAQLMDELATQGETAIRDIHDGRMSGASLPGDILQSLNRRLRPAPRRAAELDRIIAAHGRLLPAECWPELRVLGVWSGGSVGAYLPALERHFPTAVVCDHGLHASEGRMTLPVDDQTSSGVLEVESHYFEFIPVEQEDAADPDVLEAHELQEGREYFILLTTCAGLYRYNIRDVVRCTGFLGATPLLEFLHKGAHISSVTGEKIAESQAVEAVRTAAAGNRIPLKTWTLTPVWGHPPGYRLYLEADSPGIDTPHLQLLAQSVDEQLSKLNVEYAERRVTGRLQGVTIEVLSADIWRRFVENRTTAGGGSPEQYKHPCLMPDPGFAGLFLLGCGLSPMPGPEIRN